MFLTLLQDGRTTNEAMCITDKFYVCRQQKLTKEQERRSVGDETSLGAPSV